MVLFGVLFSVRSLFVTAGYHRYFSHRSYKLNRFWQAVFAFQAQASAQKGVLWWAAKHRQHHRHADTPLDVHSPRQGFLWSHVGWILCDQHKATDYETVKDLARYPELRWLNRHDRIAAIAYGVGAFLIGGWSGLVVGFFWSTVLLWHSTFLVNSAARLRPPALRHARHQSQLAAYRAARRSARAGTTITTAIRRRPAKGSSGGSST